MKPIIPPPKVLPIAIAPIPDIALESPAIAFCKLLVVEGLILGFMTGVKGFPTALVSAF